MVLSFWEQLSHGKSWDLLIVGGGFAGLNMAIQAKRHSPGLEVGVLEAATLSLGASTKNAGFCCFGSPSELIRDIRDLGEETAFSTLSQRWKGIERIGSDFDPSRISYEASGGHELFIDPSLHEDVHRNIEWLNKPIKELIGFSPFEELSDQEISQMGFQNIDGGFRIRGEAMVDPCLLHRSLLEDARGLGVEIYFGARVEEHREKEEEVELWLQDHPIPFKTAKTVIASNGYAEQLLAGAGIDPGRGQVLITRPIKEIPFQGTFHLDQGNFYFRNVGDRVLLGGGREIAAEEEHTFETGLTDRIQNELERLLSDHLLPGQHFEIEQRWSGIMGFTEDRFPRMRAVGTRSYLMAGFSGMGVALSFATGRSMAEHVLGALE